MEISLDKAIKIEETEYQMHKALVFPNPRKLKTVQENREHEWEAEYHKQVHQWLKELKEKREKEEDDRK